MSGKRTLGLGHMSRKTPEVKIGLYSPLSQLTGCLKPREGICHIVGLGAFSDHFSTVTSGLDLRYYTTDKWHCSCPLVTKILVRTMTGAWLSSRLGCPQGTLLRKKLHHFPSDYNILVGRKSEKVKPQRFSGFDASVIWLLFNCFVETLQPVPRRNLASAA